MVNGGLIANYQYMHKKTRSNKPELVPGLGAVAQKKIAARESRGGKNLEVVGEVNNKREENPSVDTLHVEA